MGIEDLLDHRTGRRSFILNSLTVLLAGAGLPSFVRAEEDYYANAYRSWRSGDLGKAEVLLKKGVNASAKKQQAECYHFLGYLSAQNNDRDTAKELYAKAFEIADIKSGYVDEVYEQALRADFISEGGRVVDSDNKRTGSGHLTASSKSGKGGSFKGDTWNDYYFRTEKTSIKLQNLFKKSVVSSQREIDLFMNDFGTRIFNVTIFDDGYFKAMVKDNNNPSGYYAIVWKTEVELKRQIQDL